MFRVLLASGMQEVNCSVVGYHLFTQHFADKISHIYIYLDSTLAVRFKVLDASLSSGIFFQLILYEDVDV